MMEKETLSDKIRGCTVDYEVNDFNDTLKEVNIKVIPVDDLKATLKELKEKARWTKSGFVGQMITIELEELIDELFGDGLV